jgi:hypothetical protein
MALQGGHQSAPKSTNTGLSAFTTSLSKLLSVTSMVFNKVVIMGVVCFDKGRHDPLSVIYIVAGNSYIIFSSPGKSIGSKEILI